MYISIFCNLTSGQYKVRLSYRVSDNAYVTYYLEF